METHSSDQLLKKSFGIKTSLNIKIIPMKNIFCQIYVTEINDYVNESRTKI